MWWIAAALALAQQGQSTDIALYGAGYACGTLPGIEASPIGEPGTRCFGGVGELAVAPLVEYRDGRWVRDVVPLRFSVRVAGARMIGARWSLTASAGLGFQTPPDVAQVAGTYDLGVGFRRRLSELGVLRADLFLPTGQRRAWMGEGVPRVVLGTGRAWAGTRWEVQGEWWIGTPIGRLRSPDAQTRVPDGVRIGANGGLILDTGRISPVVMLHTRATFPRIEQPFLAIGLPVEGSAGLVGRWRSGSASFTVGRGAWLGPGSARWRYNLSWRVYSGPPGSAPSRSVAPEPPEPTRQTPLPEPVLEDRPDPTPEPACVPPDACPVPEPPPAPPPMPEVDLRFAFGSTVLLPESEPDLEVLAHFLRNEGQTRGVVLSGAASAEGDAVSNYRLALGRAAEVYARLVEAGVSPSRMSIRAEGEVPGGARVRRVAPTWGESRPTDGPARVPWRTEVEEEP